MTRLDSDLLGPGGEVELQRVRTVLFVQARHLGSVGLRSVIDGTGELRLVAQATLDASAVSAARHWHPDLVVVAADGVSHGLVRVLHDVHDASPESALVVFTNEAAQERHRILAQVPVQGILLWSDSTPNAVRTALELVAQGLYVRSGTVAQAVADLDAVGRSLRERVNLSSREKAVLRALAIHDTQAEVAAALNMGDRTLHEVVGRLKAKLQVSTTFMLGAWAQALGLVELDDPVE